MGIGSVNSDTSYYGYSIVTKNKSNNTYAASFTSPGDVPANVEQAPSSIVDNSISETDDIKSEAIDIFYKMYDESRSNSIVNETVTTTGNIDYGWEKNLQCREAIDSTAEDPVYEVSTIVNGESITQKIHINDFKPTNATQAEMCAMFAYYDSINGTEGTYDKFMAYMETGTLHGYGDGNETYDDFTSKRYNFRYISAEVSGDLYRVGLTKDVYNEACEIHDIVEKDFVNKLAREIGDDLPRYVQKNGTLMEHQMTASLPDIPQEIAVALTNFFYEDESTVEKYGSDFIGELNTTLEFHIAKQIDEDGTRGNIEEMWNSAISVIESLSDKLDTFFGDKLGNMDSVKAQVEELKGLYNQAIGAVKEAKNEALGVSESETSEDSILRQMLAQYIAEMLEKIKSGDTEQEFQIGSISLTLKEWDELIDKFDYLEEELKEEIEAEIKKQMEAEDIGEASKADDTLDNTILLSSEIRKTVFREATETKPELSYITYFTSEGIICKRTEMGENEYLWKMDFENEQDYERVKELLDNFPDDWNLKFAPNEKFWKDYLSERIDKDDFVNNLQQYSDKGKMNYLIERDGNTYIDRDAAKYCNYMNNPEDRIYTPQEFTDIIAEELRTNQKKMVDPNDEETLTRIDERIEQFKRDMLGGQYNKINHKDYFSDNYIWRADNKKEKFEIYSRTGKKLASIKYFDLMRMEEDTLISNYNFDEELLKTLSYVKEEKY